MKWESTKYPGVRFRKHPSRKHGVNFDRYFTIRYQKNALRNEEGLGWASDGWTAEKANAELSKLKEATRLGEGPQRLAEKRNLESIRREKLRLAEDAQMREAVSFNDYFDQSYFPSTQLHKKRRSLDTEMALFNKWISPVIGELPLKEIHPSHIRALKKRMKESDKSLATIRYAMAVISQVWSHALSDGLVEKRSPTKDKTTKVEHINNNRLRFLSKQEAEELLSTLKISSPHLHDMALLSLFTGARAGEIFKLTWDCVDFDQHTILLKDTKNKQSRHTYMTERVIESLSTREKSINGLVFKNKHGDQIKEIPNSFGKVVKILKFNDGITDRRDKVVFHTLRHTFASWLAMNGTDLYVIKELMGHSSIKMTERYAHLQENSLKNAIKNLEKS